MKLHGWRVVVAWAVVITVDLLLLGFALGLLSAGLRELTYLSHRH